MNRLLLLGLLVLLAASSADAGMILGGTSTPPPTSVAVCKTAWIDGGKDSFNTGPTQLTVWVNVGC